MSNNKMMSFGLEDDDSDFTLCSDSGSSKLASIFRGDQIYDEANSSLTYTAPKQPRKHGRESSPAAQMTVIHAVGVNAFKLENGKYVPRGKVGAAILGSYEHNVFQVLLYRGKKEHLACARVDGHFHFTVQTNNYANFYDGQRQNWSIMFDSSDEIIEFAKQILIAKAHFFGSKLEVALSQDVVAGSGPNSEIGDVLEIIYTGHLLTDRKIFDENISLGKPLRFRLGKGKIIVGLEEGLRGVKKGCRRFVIVPPNLGYASQGQEGLVPPNATLIYDVEVIQINPPKEQLTSDSGTSSSETPVTHTNAETAKDIRKPEAGEDTTSVKARGQSISDQLSTSPKANKAEIISRMARMGAQTLPLPSHTRNHSESSDNDDDPPTAKPAVKAETLPKPVVRPRHSIEPQPMVLYQTHPWQSQFRGMPSDNVPPQSYYTAPPPPTNSAAIDSHLSMLLSETRSQSTEVRIAISRVTDRLEQVYNKVEQVQNVQQQQQFQQQQMNMYSMQSPSVVGVESLYAQNAHLNRLIEENATLKKILDDRDPKNELGQTDDMEGSSELELLQKTNEQLLCKVRDLSDVNVNLGNQLADSSRRLEEVEQAAIDNENRLTAEFQEELNTLRRTYEMESKRHLDGGGKEMAKLLEEKAHLEEKLQRLQRQLHHKEVQREEKDKFWQIKYVELQKEMDIVHRNILSIRQINPNVFECIKLVMNHVYRSLQKQFDAEATYEGSHVRTVFADTIREVTLHFLKDYQPSELSESEREELDTKSSKGAAAPPAASRKEKTPEKEDEIIEEEKWRPHPPPPPMFDEEDEDWLT